MGEGKEEEDEVHVVRGTGQSRRRRKVRGVLRMEEDQGGKRSEGC